MASGLYDRDAFCGRSPARAPHRSGDEDRYAARGRGRGAAARGRRAPRARLTPWALDTSAEDMILFIEDADEPPYRIDTWRQPRRLRRALSGVRGFVFRHEGPLAADRGDSRPRRSSRRRWPAWWDPLPSASSGHSTGPNVTLSPRACARPPLLLGGRGPVQLPRPRSSEGPPRASRGRPWPPGRAPARELGHDLTGSTRMRSSSDVHAAPALGIPVRCRTPPPTSRPRPTSS